MRAIWRWVSAVCGCDGPERALLAGEHLLEDARGVHPCAALEQGVREVVRREQRVGVRLAKRGSADVHRPASGRLGLGVSPALGVEHRQVVLDVRPPATLRSPNRWRYTASACLRSCSAPA